MDNGRDKAVPEAVGERKQHDHGKRAIKPTQVRAEKTDYAQRGKEDGRKQKTQQCASNSNEHRLIKSGFGEREVLQLRYGLLDKTSRTLAEVGKILHISRERVRQIEANALQKLRAKRSDQLKDLSEV